MATPTDAELMDAAVDDPTAFASVYERHSVTMYRYLARRIPPTDAELLLSELFMTAFEHRHRFDPARGEVLHWLYGIGSNLLGKHRRSQVRRINAIGRLWSAGQVDPDPDGVVNAATAQADLAIVAEAITALPEADRSTLLLYVWENLSYDEIATTLEIPVGTVRSRISRARGRIRSACPQLEEGTWS